MAALAGIIFDYGRTLHDPERGDFYPDAAPTLATLAATHRLAIVSLVSGEDYAARRAAREALLRERDLARHFATTQFGPRDKDRLYQAALADLGLEPRQVAIVDDRIARGIAWGNRHGATTVWFRNGKFRDELPNAATGAPTHTIAALGDLPRVLTAASDFDAGSLWQ